jgi:outer membrane receptor protein involved in Fe transport
LHNEDGILESTGEERKDVRLNLTQQVNDRLQVAARANYIDKDVDFIPEGEQTQGVLTSIIFTPPSFDPFFDPELGRFPYNPLLGANPFDVIENWVADEEVNRFIGSFEGRYRPIEDLSVRYLFGLDDYRLKNTYLQPPFSTSAIFGGSIQVPSRFSQQFTSEATADHNYLIPGIEFSSLAGYRYTRDRAEVIRAAAEDLPPGQGTVIGATEAASQTISVLERAEFFFQEQVTFGDRLTLTGAFNYEGASAFGDDERWQIYPKFGVAWLLDREPWWEGSGVSGLFSTLKLRAAYGESGGQPPGAYELFNNFVSLDFAGRPGRVPSIQLGNEGLKPEREREIEGGFTAGLLDDRLSVDFTYYHDTTEDLILSVPQTPSRGVAFQLQNIGELVNQGWELSLENVNLTGENLTWRSRLAVAGNENEVQKLVTAQDSLLFGYLTWVIEDQPVGVFYGWHYARDESGNIILGEDGIPDRAFNEEGVASRKFLGDPNPDLVASLANTFSWGANLNFYVLFDGRFGNEVANFSRRISEFFGADPKIAEEISGEKPQGYYARNAARLLTYEEFIEPGWFVKLREVSASYRFTQPWVGSFGARGLTVRLAGRNLYTWTDYSGLDPEINLFGFNTVARGVDFANAPIPRTVSASLTFEF